MKLRRLLLENYRRHVRTEVEWPDGVTAIVGRNGSGKSSLLEAIAFALFGVAATRTSKDLLRFDGAPATDALRVELECEVDGQAVNLVRALRGKNATATASLAIDGQVIVPSQSGSSDAVTQEVQRLIGLDRDAFFTSVFSQQKELGRLASHSPADRKRLILGMLGIDALDDAIRTARKHRNETRIRVETLREGMPDLDALKEQETELVRQQQAAAQVLEKAREAHRRAEVVVQAADQRLGQARKRHEARNRVEAEVQRLTAQVESAENALAKAQQQREEAAAAAKEAAALASAPAAVDAARRRLEEAETTAQAAKRRMQVEQRLAALQAEAEVLEKQAQPSATNGLEERLRATMQSEAEHRHAIEAADEALRSIRDRRRRIASLGAEAPCPVCERPLADHLGRLEHRYEVESHDAEQRLVQHRQAHDEATRALRTLQKQQAEQEQALRGAQDAERRLAGIEAERRALASELEQLPARRPDVDIEGLKDRLAEATRDDRRRIRAEALAERFPALQEDEQSLRARLEAERQGLQAAQQNLATMPPTEAEVRQHESAHRDAQDTERAAEREVSRLTQELAVTEQQVAATRRERDQARQRIERLRDAETSLEHWGILVGGRHDGLLDRFRTHMVGRIRPALSAEASRLLERFTGGRYDEVILDDEYRIFVSDGGVRYAVERFSGGETDLVHLAIRLAVSRLLLERSGGIDVRLLVLDEVFGSLDDERREHVLAALQELGGLYSQVLVVTHHDALRDALDSTLLVEEHDGEAHVAMHNG